MSHEFLSKIPFYPVGSLWLFCLRLANLDIKPQSHNGLLQWNSNPPTSVSLGSNPSWGALSDNELCDDYFSSMKNMNYISC